MSAGAATPVPARGDVAPRPRFSLTRSGWAGAALLSVILLAALLGPWLAPFDLGAFVSDDGFAGPAGRSLLGADYLGRDLFSRILFGAQLTIGMAVTATIIASACGAALGIFAAVRGGWTDLVVSRAMDTIHSFPTLMLALVVIAAVGPSVPTLIVLTGLIYSTSVFRIARALGMDAVVMDYVQVARARGEGTGWVLFHEILPNVFVPLLVDFGIRLSSAILFLGSLSFLGLGVQPPMADWGSLVRENMPGLVAGSLAAIYPALCIAAFSVSVNLIVDDVAAKSGRDIASRIA